MSDTSQQSGRRANRGEREKRRAERRREREEYKNKANVVGAINSIADELAENSEEQNTSERHRARREKITIGFVILTTVATFITAWIFWRTMMDGRDAQRPYISVSSPLGDPEYHTNGSGKGVVRWTITFENYGRSPAYNATYRAFMKIGTGKYFEVPVREASASIAPTQRVFSIIQAPDNRAVTDAEFKTLMSTDQAIRVYVLEDYFDGYHTEYQDPVCLSHLTTGNKVDCTGEDDPTKGE